MKGTNGGSKFFKEIISTVRAKTDFLKTRLLLTTFTLLPKRKIASVSTKINEAIFGRAEANTAIVLYENRAVENHSGGGGGGDEDEDEKYPDLRHCLFEEEEEKELAELLEDPSSAISAIEIVKNDREKFNLEDEIDEVADLFITKFHKRMRLQKLLSFKRQAAAADAG